MTKMRLFQTLVVLNFYLFSLGSSAHPVSNSTSTSTEKTKSLFYTKSVSGYKGKFVNGGVCFSFAAVGAAVVYFATLNFESKRENSKIGYVKQATKAPLQTLTIAIATFQAIRLTFSGLLQFAKGIENYYSRKDGFTAVDMTRLEHH